MAWIAPVINRTQDDINALVDMLNRSWEDFNDGEKATYLAGVQGALNAKDYKRVQNNIALLLEIIESKNTVMDVPEFPTTEFYANIKNNLQTLADYPLVYKTTPAVPALPYNTWEKWNDIEKILTDGYIMVNSFVTYYCHTGFSCGTGIDLLE